MNTNQNNWITCIDHPKFIEIAQVIAASDIKGKGEFYVNTSQDTENSYLIASTRYGNSFVYYNVNLTNQSLTLISGRGITPPYENPLHT